MWSVLILQFRLPVLSRSPLFRPPHQVLELPSLRPPLLVCSGSIPETQQKPNKLEPALLVTSPFFSSFFLLICKVISLLISLFFKNLYFIYFYFWLRWVFVAARGLSLVAASGDYSMWRCAGFSLWWLLLLWNMGSRCTGFSSCGTWAQ